MSLFGQNNTRNYTRFGITNIRQWSPCCSLDLDRGAIFVAIIQMVMACLGIVTGIIVLIMTWTYPEERNPLVQRTMQNVGLSSWRVKSCILLLISTAYFCLHLYLYKGVKQRDYCKVDQYLKMMVGFLVALLLIFGIASLGWEFVAVSDSSVGIFDIYTLWVIYAYRKELGEGSLGDSQDHTVEWTHPNSTPC